MPVPELGKAEWKGPVGGHEGRDPSMVFKLEVFLKRAAGAGGVGGGGGGRAPIDIRVWEPLATLLGFFGDHRVEVASHAESPALVWSGLPWRKSQHCHRMEAMLSWLASPEPWRAMAVTGDGAPAGSDRGEGASHRRAGSVLDSLVTLHATRGGGNTHHGVWMLEWSPGVRDFPGQLRLAVRTRHVPNEDVRKLNTLVRTVCRLCEPAGAHYARGALVPIEQTRGEYILEAPFGDTLGEDVWRQCDPLGPIVPSVYRFNFLGPEHVARLGGVGAIRAFGRSADGPWVVDEIGAGVLITAAELHPIDLMSMDSRTSRGGEMWLSGLFARANLLAVQQTEWVDRALARAREYQRGEAQRSASGVSAGAHDSGWFKRLRDRPPRFIAAVAGAAEGAFAGAAPPELGGFSTVFTIRPPGDGGGSGGSAVTLYGAKARGDDGAASLRSPIRAGSMKAERAIFEFDAACHGYDGELSEPSDFPAEEHRRLAQFTCPNCDGRLFWLRAEFQYPDDLPESLESEQMKHAEDFFDWFRLEARCAGCNWQGVAADIECA